ncbi:MAG: hypothetical protein QM582_04020 [Micropruina sp.]|uniref:SDH family Clp fold serine proteinase n=1 Tax=Micropruina sp. TaxID=2737536 RepID=UPI0039E648A3
MTDAVKEPGSLAKTPLFEAQHADRYARQELIRTYEQLTGAQLIVLIDQIFARGLTVLQELLIGLDRSRELHVLLATPGGDGEVAVRMIRAMQARCTRLVIIVPDMAKSAGTLMCLGADVIRMAPFSDLGPVDPQFQVGNSLAGAKEIVAAVATAEDRVAQQPNSYPLYSALLADVTMLMVEQAKAAITRTEALIDEALQCRTEPPDDTERGRLVQQLRRPLIDDPTDHAATVGPKLAERIGLPVEVADLDSESWTIIWQLWTRYFALGCYPAGARAIYEGRLASHMR